MKLSKVKTLFLGLTNKCNAMCIHCWHSNTMQHGVLELNPLVYIQLRDQLFNHLEVLDLAGGGEVFLSPLFQLIMEDAKQYKFKTIITSNFSCISAEQRLILKDANVEFIVSLDGSTKEIQEYIRPQCKYDTVIDNIDYFIRHGKKVAIQMTVSDSNYYDMQSMLDLAVKLGVDHVRLQGARFLNNLDEPYKFTLKLVDVGYMGNLHSTIPFSVYFEHYHKPMRNLTPRGHYKGGLFFWNRPYCSHTVGAVKVQEDGRLQLCCMPSTRIIGDLNKESLVDIIDTKRFDTYRKLCRCVDRKR